MHITLLEFQNSQNKLAWFQQNIFKTMSILQAKPLHEVKSETETIRARRPAF